MRGYWNNRVVYHRSNSSGGADMKTDQEILERIEYVKSIDPFGFAASDLIIRLPFDVAKPFLKDDADPTAWKQLPRDKQSVLSEMHEYMDFAWEKANNNRGISAWRSLAHYSAWLWLAGYTEAADALTDYDQYGKPQLRAICEFFEWDWQSRDDGRWTNDEMGQGWPAPETVSALPGME